MKESSISRIITKLRRRPTVGLSAPKSTEEALKRAEAPKDSPAARAMADNDVPLLFKECVEDEPFNYLHVALRVGPLVIENGSK
jgi:hypothetical protein